MPELRPLAAEVDLALLDFLVELQVLRVELRDVRLLNGVLELFFEFRHVVLLFEDDVDDEVVQSQVRAIEILVNQVEEVPEPCILDLDSILE